MTMDGKDIFKDWFFNAFLEYQRRIGQLISIRDLSRHLGVSQPTVTAWLSGRNMPSGENVERIAALFGDGVYDALGLERPNPYIREMVAHYTELPEEKRREVWLRIAEIFREYGVRRVE